MVIEVRPPALAHCVSGVPSTTRTTLRPLNPNVPEVLDVVVVGSGHETRRYSYSAMALCASVAVHRASTLLESPVQYSSSPVELARVTRSTSVTIGTLGGLRSTGGTATCVTGFDAEP